jgi:hypothetical protein
MVLRSQCAERPELRDLGRDSEGLIIDKVEMFKCTREILISGNEHFCCVRLRAA